MVHRLVVVSLSFVSAALATTCQGTPSGGPENADQVVSEVATRHSDVVRLTVHAMPKGESQARVVGSTSAAKRGKPSDPEDLRALQTGAEVVLEEGQNLDVTVPMFDASTGKPSWVVGVTLQPRGRARQQVIEGARTIAGEVGAAVRAAKKPLW